VNAIERNRPVAGNELSAAGARASVYGEKAHPERAEIAARRLA
jgi:hypothetical protein